MPRTERNSYATLAYIALPIPLEDFIGFNAFAKSPNVCLRERRIEGKWFLEVYRDDPNGRAEPQEREPEADLSPEAKEPEAKEPEAKEAKEPAPDPD
jgi:hypothetical protein